MSCSRSCSQLRRCRHFAHPLHGAAADFTVGVAHPFLGLDHVLAMVAVGIWSTRLGGRALWLVPLSFVCGMLAGSLIGLTRIPVSAVEPIIAASVLAFGVLLLIRRNPTLVPCALIAAVFAVFHGIGHTAGMSISASAQLFVAGLALGALLHVVGMAALKLPKAIQAAGVMITLAGCYLLAGAFLMRGGLRPSIGAGSRARIALLTHHARCAARPNQRTRASSPPQTTDRLPPTGRPRGPTPAGMVTHGRWSSVQGRLKTGCRETRETCGASRGAQREQDIEFFENLSSMSLRHSAAIPWLLS